MIDATTPSPAYAPTRLMTPSELEERYRIPKATAAKWRWAGSGPPFVKFGSRVLYREDDVEDWMAGNRHTPTAANS